MQARAALVLFALWCAPPVHAQSAESGAVAIADGVRGFATRARVLMIGAHPDDEDTNLITWLARGRHVETAYLSLTRGDGGQNIIGNELGEALGAIRTEELLAARRIDGGRQYFTRAYDFGFSKDSAETFTHWPRDVILGDVVRVVRAFRPHVIVGVFSGTAADGHGQHTVSGVFARNAYDLAGDTVRFPVETYGAAWTAAKFYRVRRGTATPGALRINTGEYDAVRGRALGELAAESRTQHKSQGQGRPLPLGVQWTYVLREATRVNAATNPAGETSLFDGIDTSWTRFAGAAAGPAQRALVDSLPGLSFEARSALDLARPEAVVPLLARAAGLLERARAESPCRYAAVALACSAAENDLGASIEVAHRRAGAALLAAAGVTVEALADRELLAFGDTASVTLQVVNRGTHAVTLRGFDVPGRLGARDTTATAIAPDSATRRTAQIRWLLAASSAWWIGERSGMDFFPEVLWPADGARGARNSPRTLPSTSGVAIAEDAKLTSWADVRLEVLGHAYTVRSGPLVYRRTDAVHGELHRPMLPVTAVSLLFDRTRELVRVGVPVDRIVRLRIQSQSTQPRHLRFQFKIPDGLTADGLIDTLTMAPLETRDLSIRLRGQVAHAQLPMTAFAVEGVTLGYGNGLIPIEYPHIRPLVLTRSAGVWVQGVETAIPEAARVAYVRGVSDDVAPVLQQLGLRVTQVAPDQLAATDLAQFDVIVLGPRAYAYTPSLAAANPALEAFARRGGTVVVQYGQQEMSRAGMLPYAVTIPNQPQRVTLEDAPIRVVDSLAGVLRAPNRITDADFRGWVQERALYMPSRVDSAWRPVLEMNDPGEPPNRNALLVARVGAGTYVYTTMSFLRQLPSGNEGAIRLFMNLLNAGRRTAQ